MAMIAQAVLLSLSVQSLLATTDTSTTVNGSLSTSPASTEGASEMTSPSSTDQTDVDNQTMPTQVSTTLANSLTNSTGLTETSATTTELPTETVSTVTMVPTLSTVTPTSESQMSTQSQTNKGDDGGTTTILSGTTSSMSSTTQMMTSGLIGELTTSRGTKEAPGPERVSLAVYIAIGVVGGLFVLVVIFALSVWCLRRKSSGKSKRRRGARNPFAQDEMDKLDPKERMSMHRPNSATVNAEGDLAFVTFITGAASPDSHVDGIENPTYALGPNGDAGEPTEKTAGAGDQSNTATLPSQVQLSNEGPTDGAHHDDKKYADRKGANLRPQSGVSYTSNDIEGALETIDSM
ncbi:uncharacterized protein LOC110978285 [Acanthaster planci]|uniref:Uncharacterized protein LOC110978285 n=1 Tax=Acanthaster planci TaxID=133434 RepID=A0A8B7Y927_ACAPL|nr:uncharacterized protein LOC110978285 [Acanthaster planci]